MAKHSMSKPPLVSLAVFTFVAVALSSIARAGDTLSLASDTPEQLIVVDRYRVVGIKKVGYEDRYGHKPMSLHGNTIPLASKEPLSLSSLFWTSPFVLSLQLKTSELQR
jgi:hypothetical protein